MALNGSEPTTLLLQKPPSQIPSSHRPGSDAMTDLGSERDSPLLVQEFGEAIATNTLIEKLDQMWVAWPSLACRGSGSRKVREAYLRGLSLEMPICSRPCRQRAPG